MAKNAYMIITDLHLGNIAATSRIDYRNEITRVKTALLETAMKYKKCGWNVIALMLGDVFHGSYRDVTTALMDADFINLWRLKIGEIYTVLGNHELTYYKANPFYALIASVESERVCNIINKVWTPLGLSNVVRIVDRLVDGEVCFYFNHYSTGIQKPGSEECAIGLFHQDIIDRQIVEEVQQRYNKSYYGNTVALETSGILDGYKHCYFGHIHTVYGIWKANDVYLHYLASLGRTNEKEVSDDFLERNIPVILVEDGRYRGQEDNFIQLLSRSECISESEVEINHEIYLGRKERKDIREYKPILDDPVNDLEIFFQEDLDASRILTELRDSRCSWLITLKSRLRGIGIEN